MRVRPFTDSDAPALARIFFDAVREIASVHYTREQVIAWAPVLPSPDHVRARAADGRTLLVAVDDSDIPVAYGDCEADGHIDHLFCLPTYSRQGVAAAVFKELERMARMVGIGQLYVEASEPARRFFSKQGFNIEGRNDFEINDVAIHNWRMTKHLTTLSTS